MNPIKEYSAFLEKKFSSEVPVYAVCDASNGSAGEILKKIKAKNLKIKIINAKPDGDFPAHGPNPSGEGARNELRNAVISAKADFGAIFDADGDRVLFVDDKGRDMHPDESALLISGRFAEPVLADVRSGWALRKNRKIKIMKVGHHFIKKEMRKKKIEFAAEATGHYYFEYKFGTERAYFDSGIRAFMEFAGLVGELKGSGVRLSVWASSLPLLFRSGEMSVKAKNPEKLFASLKEKFPQSQSLDGISFESKKPAYWFNVRKSNTEPVVRITAEAENSETLKEVLKKIKSSF